MQNNSNALGDNLSLIVTMIFYTMSALDGLDCSLEHHRDFSRHLTL